MSYTEISPDENPMPTTSRAGERASTVTAAEVAFEGDVRRDAAGNV